MSRLPLREKLFVFFLCSLILFLALLSAIHDSSTPYKYSFSLNIVGAVRNPGVYTLNEKTSLAELLAEVKPLENANLQGIPPKISAFQQNTLLLPSQGFKAIYLKGAVKKEGPFLVPEEACIKDLKSLNLLSEGADPRFCKRKRLLKNQEEVIVPGTNQKKVY